MRQDSFWLDSSGSLRGNVNATNFSIVRSARIQKRYRLASYISGQSRQYFEMIVSKDLMHF